jgi:hypothetical protein
VPAHLKAAAIHIHVNIVLKICRTSDDGVVAVDGCGQRLSFLLLVFVHLLLEGGVGLDYLLAHVRRKICNLSFVWCRVYPYLWHTFENTLLFIIVDVHPSLERAFVWGGDDDAISLKTTKTKSQNRRNTRRTDQTPMRVNTFDE